MIQISLSHLPPAETVGSLHEERLQEKIQIQQYNEGWNDTL